MFNSTTLRNVMSALALALVISTCSATMANACDENQDNSPVKVERLTLLNKIKHLFSSRNNSTKSEPQDDAGYVPTDDAGQLPITP